VIVIKTKIPKSLSFGYMLLNSDKHILG